MDDVKSQMEGVTRVYNELDDKISDKGGVQNLFGMNRKIRQALESISIGELDSMLERAALNQERELDSMMGALVGLLGPLLIVVMGLFVMGIVFAMLMPIFEMNNLIR